MFVDPGGLESIASFVKARSAAFSGWSAAHAKLGLGIHKDLPLLLYTTHTICRTEETMKTK